MTATFTPMPGEKDPGCYTRCCNCASETRTMIGLAHLRTLCGNCIVESFAGPAPECDVECDRCGATATTCEVVDNGRWYEMVNVCSDCIGQVPS